MNAYYISGSVLGARYVYQVYFDLSTNALSSPGLLLIKCRFLGPHVVSRPHSKGIWESEVLEMIPKFSNHSSTNCLIHISYVSAFDL